MSKQTKYNYDELTGKAEVIIWDKGKKYRGTAIPSAEDMDVKAKYTGLTLANAKAEIVRNNKKALECLKEIAKREKEIENLKKRASAYVSKKAEIEQELNQYIDKKSEFASRLRQVKAKRNSTV